MLSPVPGFHGLFLCEGHGRSTAAVLAPYALSVPVADAPLMSVHDHLFDRFLPITPSFRQATHTRPISQSSRLHKSLLTMLLLRKQQQSTIQLPLV
jgi:hypothetical protein